MSSSPQVGVSDQRIIAALRINARATLAEIGAAANLSASAVARRIDRLEESGVIRGYTAIVDDAQTGLPIEAFCEVTFAGDARVADIAGIADGMVEVKAVFTTAGDPDALVWVRVRDVAHLTTVIDRLRRSRKVAGTKTLMVLDTWRPNFDAGGSPDF